MLCPACHIPQRPTRQLSTHSANPVPRLTTPLPGAGGELTLDSKACCGRGVLHLPPEKHKVAHGDVNLDINDFLAKIGV